MDVSNDVRTLEELERNPAKLIRRVRANRRPMIITSEGKPGVVIIPADVMTKKMTALQAACELAGP